VLDESPSIFSLIALVLLAAVWGGAALTRGRFTALERIRPLWGIFVAIAVAEWVSFTAALWILAILSFCALREYLSLVDIRLQDRWGILVSYLSIPFMFYLIQINWYGFFIVSIPVYAFLLVPFFVALGGRSEGIVFSVGALDFGLFFYVFCIGHLAYLMFFSERITMLMVATVAVAGAVAYLLQHRNVVLSLLVQVLAAVGLFVGLAGWTGIPGQHCVGVGILIPVLVCLGRFTIREIEGDLGIRADRLQPGRGRLIEALKCYLFTVPITFHYLRWFLKWGDELW
jgi:phosphatidate cytidylyltransferase